MTSNFRSKLEAMVAGLLGPEWQYEPFNLTYQVQHRYTPDFVYEHEGGREILVEVKGFFRAGDTQKYKAIAQECKETDREFVFFLSNPFKKVRKGGMLTMAQWCDKEGIRWFFDTVELQEYADANN
jgi:hypothetical protein